MPSLYSISDLGDAISVGGVIYKKVGTDVPAVPDTIAPDAVRTGAFVYNVADGQGNASYDADKHLLAMEFGYENTLGTGDDVQTLYASAPFAGVLRIWQNQATAVGTKNLFINGTPTAIFWNNHQGQANAYSVNVQAGDLIQIDKGSSNPTFEGAIYKFVYNGEVLP